MKRAALLLLCIVLVWVGSVLACLTFPLRMVFAFRSLRTKNLLRLMDHTSGLAWFGSDWWESLSANSARVRRRWLVAALDIVEEGHCKKALEGEQDVIDFFNRRK